MKSLGSKGQSLLTLGQLHCGLFPGVCASSANKPHNTQWFDTLWHYEKCNGNSKRGRELPAPCKKSINLSKSIIWVLSCSTSFSFTFAGLTIWHTALSTALLSSSGLLKQIHQPLHLLPHACLAPSPCSVARLNYDISIHYSIPCHYILKPWHQWPLTLGTIASSSLIQQSLPSTAPSHIHTLYSCKNHFSVRNTLWWTDNSTTWTVNSRSYYWFSPLYSGQCNQVYKYLWEGLLRKWVIIGISCLSPATEAWWKCKFCNFWCAAK